MYKYFTFTLLLISLFSCEKENSPYLYEAVSFELGNAKNNGGTLQKTISNRIDKNIYAIHIEYFNKFKGDSGNNADPYESAYKNQYKTETFDVYSLDSFNTIPPGTSLNDNFKVDKEYYNPRTISDIVNSNLVGDSDFQGDQTTWYSDQYLVFNISPTDTGFYRFVLLIEQSNGSRLIDTVSVTLY
jgi:hypothetical protein